MLSGLLGRSVLSLVRCSSAPKHLQAALMRTPRRGAKSNGAAKVIAAVQEETVVVTEAKKRTPRKAAKAKSDTAEAAHGVAVTVEQEVVAAEATVTPKARGKRKAAAKSPAAGKDPAAADITAAADSPAAEGAGKKLARTPSKRIGVLTSEEMEIRDRAIAEAAAKAAADAQAAAQAAAGPDAEGQEPPPPKKKRQKKQPWPPGPIYEQSMRPPAFDGPATRIVSWNVAGLRSLLKKDPEAVRGLVQAEQASILCLQETKLQEQHVEDAQAELGLSDWSHTWNCSTIMKGYSGTAIFSREPPLSVQHGLEIEDHDQEGRVITAEFPGFFVTTVYTPNSGEGLRRLAYRTERWDADFATFVRRLRQRKPVIVTGDLNCAHKEIDIHEPKRNLRSAGFTEEERQSFTACYTEAGMVDAFREQHPGVVAYTYFSHRMGMRAKGKGWRLDYFLVSDDLHKRVHDCYHLPHIMGSDHVPIGLVLKHGEGQE